VGGTNSLDEDRMIVSKSKGRVLFYVKAWEPPTAEFLDFLHTLATVTEKVTLFPVGMPHEHYLASESDLEIWGKKLEGMGERKVWLKI